MQTARHDAGLGSRSAVSALVAAAITGVVHGLFSIYWALGGNWLVNTLGHQLVDAFAGRRWLLIPVAAVKIGFALLPLLLARWVGSGAAMANPVRGRRRRAGGVGWGK